ncbi:unnamed protein product [Chironomus riparius]|uniref:BTB domain-containing protein n=1 Tax=Chironomus riparius TaxID=315576 RepID=A0A9P0ILB0_9DIPT|nr:unnamed protein product [Chironomus riparius]
MEEFALCWNKLKFAENLSSGFQSLFDRGDFVDCTIACDGQLLQCHKLVLAICSPYFREIFMNNPCRHPIIILKDVTFSIMSELLQFMYQGEVNVKQAELQAFMSIAESLQIKGLATNSGSNNSNNNGTNNNNNNSTSNGNNSTMRGSEAMNSSYSQFHSNNVSGGGGTANNAGVHRNHNQHQFNSAGSHTENHRQTTSTPLSTTSSIDCGNHAMKGGKHMSGESSTPQTATPLSSSSSFVQKRTIDQISEQQQQRQSQMKMKRTVHDVSDSDMNDSIDNMTSDDIFLPASMQPQVTINESPRFDANCVKRENSNDVIRPQSPGNIYRNSYHSSNSMQNTSFPYFPDFSPSDLSNSNNLNDLSKSHMEVPPAAVLPGERWFNGKLQFMLSQRGKPLLVHDGFSFGIQYIRKDKKYWQCNLSRKYNCKARVTTTDAGDIIVTNNEHCHTEIRQHLRKDYKMNKLQAQLSNQLNNHHMSFQIGDRKINLGTYMDHVANAAAAASSTNCQPSISSISTTQTSIMPRQITTTNSFPKNLSLRSPLVTPPPTETSPPSLPIKRRDSNDSPLQRSSHD